MTRLGERLGSWVRRNSGELAEHELQRGRPEKAVEQLAVVHRKYQRRWGESHPQTAIAALDLGRLLMRLHRDEEALPLLISASEVLGTVQAVMQLSLCLDALRRTAEAAQVLDGPYAALVARDPDGEDTLTLAARRVVLRSSRKPAAEDVGAMEHALAVRQQRLGPDAPETLYTAGVLAGLYFADSRYEEAAAIYERNEYAYRQAGNEERAELSAELLAHAQEGIQSASSTDQASVAARRKQDPPG